MSPGDLFPEANRPSLSAIPRSKVYTTIRMFQNVGGVLIHNSEVSVRPGFFQRCGVGFSTAAASLDAKQVRLHGGAPPGQQFHANPGTGFENLALLAADDAGVFFGCFKKRENVGAVEARHPAQCGDRGTHLSALQRAEKSDGHSGGARHLRQRQSTASAQSAEALPGVRSSFVGRGYHSLPLQFVHDGRGIQTARAAQKDGALQQANVRLGIHAVATGGALRRDQPQNFPGAKRRRRDPYTAGNFANTQRPGRGAYSRFAV